jgi:tetratricopeptide (TPR) repeat protein
MGYNEELDQKIEQSYIKALQSLSPHAFKEQYDQGNLLEAVVILHRLLKVDPDNELVTKNLPIIYSKITQSEKGKMSFMKQSKIYYLTAKDKEILSNAYLDFSIKRGNAGEYEEAISNLNKVLEFAPGNPRVKENLFAAYANLGIKHGREGGYEEAILNLEKSREFNSEHQLVKSILSTSYFYLGIKQGNEGDYEKSILSFEEALKIDPKNKDVENIKKYIPIACMYLGIEQNDSEELPIASPEVTTSELDLLGNAENDLYDNSVVLSVISSVLVDP